MSDKKQITVKLTAGQANALLHGMSEAFQEPESLYMCKYGEREHGKALRAVNKIKEALKNQGLCYLDI